MQLGDGYYLNVGQASLIPLCTHEIKCVTTSKTTRQPGCLTACDEPPHENITRPHEARSKMLLDEHWSV